MSFGNRPARAPTEEAKVDPRPAASRMVMTAGPNIGLFIAIAVAVVGLAAGGAFFLSGKMASASTREVIRPIKDLAAELDRDQLKAALVTQAFPDSAGKSLMAKIAGFPDAQDALLSQLADTAKAGGDRNELVKTLDSWRKDFAHEHYLAIGRTGTMGFDRAMQLANSQIDLWKKTGGCSISGLRDLVDQRSDAIEVTDYGTPGYNLLMQSYQAVIDLVVAGEKMPPIDPVMRVSDGKAVMGAFSSLMKDPKSVAIARNVIVSAGGDLSEKRPRGRPGKRAPPPVQQQLAPDEVDICALGKTVVGKMQGLPAETKQRVWAASISRAATNYIYAHR
jgi:hypothetical protein